MEMTAAVVVKANSDGYALLHMYMTKTGRTSASS